MYQSDLQRRPIKLRSTKWSADAAAALVAFQFTPNQVSVASSVFATAGAALLIQSRFQTSPSIIVAEYLLSAVCIQLRLLCNLLDGMMAVEYGKATRSGELFNEIPDRISDFVLLAAAGFAAGCGELGLSLGWAAAGLAICTAYLRAFAARFTKAQDFSGPMAKQQRMFALTVACLAAAIQFAYNGQNSILTAALVVIVSGTALTCLNRLKNLKNAMEKE